MIGSAILSLGEEDGSTVEAISTYISTNYDGLPPAHAFFLPYYLKKLTAAGEFVAGARGRYLLPVPLSLPPPQSSTPKVPADGRALQISNHGEGGSALPLPLPQSKATSDCEEEVPKRRRRRMVKRKQTANDTTMAGDRSDVNGVQLLQSESIDDHEADCEPITLLPPPSKHIGDKADFFEALQPRSNFFEPLQPRSKLDDPTSWMSTSLVGKRRRSPMATNEGNAGERSSISVHSCPWRRRRSLAVAVDSYEKSRGISNDENLHVDSRSAAAAAAARREAAAPPRLRGSPLKKRTEMALG